MLAAAGWWWVTWPERTAREFVELMAAQKWEESRRLQAPNSRDRLWPEIISPEYVVPGWNQNGLQPKPRSLIDVLSARQDFDMLNGWHLTIQRGELRVWKTGFPEKGF